MEDPGKHVNAAAISWEEGERLDYVTIAKAGGRRDLLYHMENVPDSQKRSTVPPPSVDWFAHPPTPPTKERSRSPYKSFLKDHWCQWDTSTLPEINSVVSTSSKASSGDKEEVTKLPSIKSKKEGVDFRRLLALDYQREWLDKRKNKRLDERKRVKDKKLAKQNKLKEHAMKAQKSHGGAWGDKSSEKRFKMKRFADIPSKLKLPPI